MNKTAVFFAVILLVWVFSMPTFLESSKIKDNYSEPEMTVIKDKPADKIVEEPVEETYENEIDGIKIGKEGVIGSEENLESKVVVDFFFDPVCLSCAQYNDIIGSTMSNLIEKNEIGVVFHPVPYLNGQTPDDYSNRASAYMLSVAEYAPEKALSYIQTVLSEKFVPKNPTKDTTSDSKFIEAMELVGLTPEQIEKVEENKEGFVSAAIAAGKEFSDEDSKWTKFSTVKNENLEQIVFTPFVLVNNNGKYENKSLELEEDLVIEFEEMIESISN